MTASQATEIANFPWHFLDLSPADKEARREILGIYASIAQYSTSLPLVAYLVFAFLNASVRKLIRRSDGQGSYEQIPLDADGNQPRAASPSAFLASRWTALSWWITGDIYLGRTSYGTRDQWLVGIIWTIWLFALSTLSTGDDYYHLSKRFGLVAMSQLPTLYAMSNKILNPFAFAFASSHEVVNRFHRVYGRVIYVLLLCHFALYLTAFVVQGTFFTRIFEPIVVPGILASLFLQAVVFTAFKGVRDGAYRLFFVVHALAGFAIPALIFFHAAAARLYVVEAAALFVLDLLCRKLTTTVAPATVQLIPGSNLLKVKLEVAPTKVSDFSQQPGSHLYLDIPPEGRLGNSGLLAQFVHNPFTVAEVDQQRGQMTLIVRARAGAMSRHLSALAQMESPMALGFEGPYGAIGSHFPRLLKSGVDRHLLIAGGVGATFIMPLYRAIQAHNPDAKIQFVWAMRAASEATWPVSPASGKSIIDDPNIQLYLTEQIDISEAPLTEHDEGHGHGLTTEMEEMDGDAGINREHRSKPATALLTKNRRPDLQRIINDVFSKGNETVAVAVCGPESMSREVRKWTGIWAAKGKDVWWHNETFGW